MPRKRGSLLTSEADRRKRRHEDRPQQPHVAEAQAVQEQAAEGQAPTDAGNEPDPPAHMREDGAAVQEDVAERPGQSELHQLADRHVATEAGEEPDPHVAVPEEMVEGQGQHVQQNRLRPRQPVFKARRFPPIVEIFSIGLMHEKCTFCDALVKKKLLSWREGYTSCFSPLPTRIQTAADLTKC